MGQDRVARAGEALHCPLKTCFFCSQVWRVARACFAVESHLSTRSVSWGLSCRCWASSTLAPTNNHSLQVQVLDGASSVCETVM